MKNLVFFLEGYSEKEMLEGLVPRLLNNPEVNVQYITFQGKQDLEKKFSDRLKGWLKPDSAFIVLVDQDKEDCKQLKERLLDECENMSPSKNLLIRIACHELESWYFGDLTSVGKALERENLISYRNRRKYRDPDKIQKPSEELDKITSGIYQKISGSRAIGKHLSLDENTSHSFKTFIKGIRALLNGRRNV